MRRSNLKTSLILVTWWWIQSLGVVLAEQSENTGSTHPLDYATVYEVRRDGHHRLIHQSTKIEIDSTETKIKDPTVTEIDDRSLISISFDEGKMREPDDSSGVVFSDQPKTTRHTHPGAYTTVTEVRRNGEEIPITLTVSEIDDRSLIAIKFNEDKMIKPDKEGDKKGVCRVKIGIKAFQTKNGDRDQIPVTKYTSRTRGEEGIVSFTSHHRSYEPGQGRDGRVPDTIIDPSRLTEQDVDQIEIRIINRQTRERVVHYLRLREFGLRAKMTDTFMFFKRPGANPDKGIDSVHFSPAAGVTYGTVYRPRNTSGINKFLQALRPGIGVNASILRWKDLALDDQGQFSNGSNGSRLNVGLGAQFSLFNNILMISYGANLQAERNPWYYGIGISFIQLNGAISGDD